MWRSAFLGHLAAPIAALAPIRRAEGGDTDTELARSASAFRYVVPVGPFRVALLEESGVLLSTRLGNTEIRHINVPRPVPEQRGWHRVEPPAVPYVNPGWNSEPNDPAAVYQPPGPDEVTFAAIAGPYAVFGFRPSPTVISRSYIVRFVPATNTLECRWISAPFDGSARGMFVRLGVVNFVDQVGSVFVDADFVL
jgi:hypothetical protein